jgi:hypothetical protein
MVANSRSHGARSKAFDRNPAHRSFAFDGQMEEAVVNNAAAACDKRIQRGAVTSILYLPEDKQRTTRSEFVLRLLTTIAIVILLTAEGAQGRTRSQEKQPLGSLSSAGEVYVNNSPAPADATIFTGDTIRTGATGTATFTSSVEGTFQVLGGSQIAFNGGDQYVSELQAGTVVVSSQRGPQGLSVRSGSYTVVGATEGELTSAKIERVADGSFAVTCLGGSVILVPAGEGSSGLLIQAGQMVDISPRGKLSSVKEAAAAPAPAPAPGEAPSTPAPAPASGSKGMSNTTKWIIAAVAIGGGAGAALALAGGHKSSSVSPSTP